jgi:hypothetical protein
VKEILSIFVVAIMLVSCQKENNSPSDLITSRNFGSVFGIDDYAEAKERFGEYIIFGVLPNGGVLIRATAHANNPERDGLASLGASFMPDKNQRANRIDAGDFFINGEKWEFQEGLYVSSDLDKNARRDFIRGLFGQAVSISLEKAGQTIVSSNFRAPVRLTQFDVANTSFIDDTHVKWLPIENVTINWNADPLNENGLVLLLTSQGDKYDEPKHGPKETHMMAAFIEEDDGEYTIPNSFFKDLSKDQLIHLTLHRGKFDYIEDDGRGHDYKFYALSEISGYFVIQ